MPGPLDRIRRFSSSEPWVTVFIWDDSPGATLEVIEKEVNLVHRHPVNSRRTEHKDVVGFDVLIDGVCGHTHELRVGCLAKRERPPNLRAYLPRPLIEPLDVVRS